MYTYMEDILSSNLQLVNKSINFLIEQAKRVYYVKNEKFLEIMKLDKILRDFALQIQWGEEWENKKPVRKADDSTNKHPGNPKPTH